MPPEEGNPTVQLDDQDGSHTRSMHAAVSAPFVQMGEILGGKYRVRAMIGRGGASVVHEAEHIELGQAVAVKVFAARSVAGDFKLALLEAKVIARLISDHVVRVIDVGTTSLGHAYFVMERLAGHDLAEEVRNGPLTISRAVELVLQACDALAEVHACGLVHRDVKPSNLFLTRRPDGTTLVKILDFGLAHSKEIEATRSTTKFCMEGSPGYASPEQLGSRDIDARADIWALGAVLYKLVTGRRPFEVSCLFEMLTATRYPVAPMASPYEPIPPEFEALVMKCLARDREARFDSVRALAAALAPFGPAHANASRPALFLASPRPERRRALSFALLGLTAGLLLAAVTAGGRTTADAAVPVAFASGTARPSSSALVLLPPLPAKMHAEPPPNRSAKRSGF